MIKLRIAEDKRDNEIKEALEEIMNTLTAYEKINREKMHDLSEKLDNLITERTYIKLNAIKNAV